MKRYAFIIDIATCENCNNCFLACKDEHCGNNWSGYTGSQPLHGHRWMDIKQKERGQFPQIDVAYLPRPCLHCDDAPCVAAGNGAVVKRDDGIVLIDPEKARERKELLASCPYGAMWWNEEAKVAQKCTMCAHLLDGGWQVPRCVQACPTGALTIFHGDDGELALKIEEERLEILQQGEKILGKPRCYYKNLYRYSQSFLAGSIATGLAEVEECVTGARVALSRDNKAVAESWSDDFGDFLFDRLAGGGEEYELAVYVNGDSPAWRGRITLSGSMSAGVIRV